MLARFCEDVTEYAALMRSLEGDEGLAEIIEDKRTIVQEYPLLSARRGTGYDYRVPDDPTNIGRSD